MLLKPHDWTYGVWLHLLGLHETLIMLESDIKHLDNVFRRINEGKSLSTYYESYYTREEMINELVDKLDR